MPRNLASLGRVLLATVMMALTNLFYKIGLQQGAVPETMVAAQAWMFCSLATLVRLIQEPRFSLTPGAWRYGALTAFALLFALVLLTHGLAIGPASVLVPVAQMSMVFTALLGAALFHERLDMRKCAGLAVAVVALLATTIASTGRVAMWSIIAIGLFNSIMFPTIFTLGIERLGRLTSKASSMLVMAIVGGALIPYLQGVLADHIGVQLAFVLPVLCYAYIAWYALRGSRPVEPSARAVAAAPLAVLRLSVTGLLAALEQLDRLRRHDRRNRVLVHQLRMRVPSQQYAEIIEPSNDPLEFNAVDKKDGNRSFILADMVKEYVLNVLRFFWRHGYPPFRFLEAGPATTRSRPAPDGCRRVAATKMGSHR